MATATPPNWSEHQQRVRDPLNTLRGYIRTYVTLEGLGVAALYLAIWFWLTLVLDWGAFQLFAFDWVQELQAVVSKPGDDFWLRATLLGLVAAGLLALVITRIGVRLIREFSDSAVAIVLERRFPRELGDRIITAVELADPKKADFYGYSAALTEKTIEEAAQRVAKLPVSGVFNWARLRWLFVKVGLATVGLYLLAWAVYFGVDLARGKESGPFDFMWKFHDAASIWFERNVLLRDSYWPRNAYLEVIRFQDTPEHPNEMRVGRDEKRPDLQVRAFQWVLADSNFTGGWRPLRWQDLHGLLSNEEVDAVRFPVDWPWWQFDRDDLDDSIPPEIIPETWQGKPHGEIRKYLAEPRFQSLLQTVQGEKKIENLLDWRTWTVDKLGLQLARKDIKSGFEQVPDKAVAEAYLAFGRVQGRLEELARSPSMTRRLRKLEIPAKVVAYSRGKTTKKEQPADLQPDNKYLIGLNELKESVRFTVNGLDFYTPTKSITLVPPPELKSLVVNKEEPAYIYQRIPGNQLPLRGHKQVFRNYNVLGATEETIITVPLGTSLTIQGQLEEGRRLRQGVRILPPDKFTEGGAVVPAGSVLLFPDQQTFSLVIDNITKTHEFQFAFNDQDNVKGKRRILIRPVIDSAPEVLDVDIEAVLRKPRFKSDPGKTGTFQTVPDGYLITPDANLPIKGNIRDDHGLTRVDWLYEVENIEFELVGQFTPSRDKDKQVLGLRGNARTRRNALVVSGLAAWPGVDNFGFAAPGYWSWVGRMMLFDLALQRNEGENAIPVETFQKLLVEKSFEEVPLNLLASKLAENARPRESWKRVAWKDGKDGFDLKKYLPKLKPQDVNREAQLHYHIRLALEAADNNVETGPGVTRNKNPFQFLVVSEAELLTQIALEEEVLSERLEKAYDRLARAKTTIQEQMSKLSDPTVALDVITIRVDEARKALLESQNITREVFGDYSRIQREAEINRLNDDYYLKITLQIVQPLGSLLNQKEGEFIRTDETLEKIFDQLENDVIASTKPGFSAEKVRLSRVDNLRQGRDQVDDLMNKLNKVLINIQQVIDASKLLEIALTLERTQRRIEQDARKIHAEEVQKLLEGLLK